mgnify:CR=1 FL=1
MCLCAYNKFRFVICVVGSRGIEGNFGFNGGRFVVLLQLMLQFSELFQFLILFLLFLQLPDPIVLVVLLYHITNQFVLELVLFHH